MTIRFGKPMDVAGRPLDSSTLRAITDELMLNIQELTGQEYVGRYAPRRAEGGDGAARHREVCGAVLRMKMSSPRAR